jgi:cytochrome b6-f complex iron-sulfur subunit
MSFDARFEISNRGDVVEEELMDDSRRNFINTCLGGVAALAVTGFASVSYPVIRYYLVPPDDNNRKGKTSIPLNAIAPGEAKFFEFNGSAAVLVRKQDGNLVALSAVCPHLGCIVLWQAEQQDFLCPCHAGYFTVDGAVISGPPPRALAKIPFAVLNGVVTIG